MIKTTIQFLLLFLIYIYLCGCTGRLRTEGSAGNGGSFEVPAWADSSNGAMGVPPIAPVDER